MGGRNGTKFFRSFIILALVISVLTSNISIIMANAATASYTTPGTSTYTVPSGVTSITVTVIGGGGGGGGRVTTPGYLNGAGGGSGYEQQYIISVTPNQQFTVIVGASGSGGADATTGGTGGTHLVGSYSQTGGNGGTGTGTGGTGRNAGTNGGYACNGIGTPGGAGYLFNSVYYGAGGLGGTSADIGNGMHVGTNGGSGAVFISYPDFSENFTVTNMQTGSAVSGLNVYVADMNSTFTANLTSPASTGVYNGDTYMVQVYGAGYITNTTYVKFTSAGTYNTLVAPRLMQTINVYDLNNNPVSNYELLLNDLGANYLYDYTNNNGPFQVYMSYNGQYSLQAKDSGYYSSNVIGFTVNGQQHV